MSLMQRAAKWINQGEKCPICDGQMSYLTNSHVSSVGGHSFRRGTPGKTAGRVGTGDLITSWLERPDEYCYRPDGPAGDQYSVHVYANGDMYIGLNGRLQNKIPVGSLDFDPKHPENVIAKIKMLEALS